MASSAFVLSNGMMIWTESGVGAVVVGGVCCDYVNVISQRPSEGFWWPVRITFLEALKIFNASFVNKAEQPTSHSCPMDNREVLLRLG